MSGKSELFKNSYLKKIAILLSILIIGILIGANIKIFLEKKFLKVYKWKSPPVIANCYSENINEENLQKAINFWRSKGESISGYIMNPSEDICESKFPSGFIIIRGKKDFGDYETLGSTFKFTLGLNIVYSVIYLRNKSDNLDLLLEHEIGHALGYTHTDYVGHIMNPEYNNMGKKFWIP